MDVSFQLYSARNGGPLEGVLRELAALGYARVEGWPGMFADTSEVAASLRRHGLTMPTAHFSFEDLKDAGRVLEIAEALGIRTVICASLPAVDRSADVTDWERFADILAGMGETFALAGYGFGWHNHAFEFQATTSGRLPMNLLLDRAPALQWEIDVAWLVISGDDPMIWLDEYGDRIRAVHVKDIAPPGEALDEDGWADVGQGVLDWPALHAAIVRKTRAEHFIVEHDNPADVSRFARRSIAAVRSWN